jgi:hypothetical protein
MGMKPCVCVLGGGGVGGYQGVEMGGCSLGR